MSIWKEMGSYVLMGVVGFILLVLLLRSLIGALPTDGSLLQGTFFAVSGGFALCGLVYVVTYLRDASRRLQQGLRPEHQR